MSLTNAEYRFIDMQLVEVAKTVCNPETYTNNKMPHFSCKVPMTFTPEQIEIATAYFQAQINLLVNHTVDIISQIYESTEEDSEPELPDSWWALFLEKITERIVSFHPVSNDSEESPEETSDAESKSEGATNSQLLEFIPESLPVSHSE